MAAQFEALSLIFGLLLVYASLGMTVMLLGARHRRIAVERRRPPVVNAPSTSVLSRMTDGAATVINARVKTKGMGLLSQDKLDRAGLRRAPADYLIITGAAASVAMLFGYFAANIFFGIICAGLTILAAVGLLNLLISRRERKFADQVPDTLQMFAGGLRAGHSFLRSVDAAATEQTAPMSEELGRVVNETRIGRDPGEALTDVARRTNSEDFHWIAQAVEIHREVGGDLAEVLDHVGETIRDRGQIQRQVASLSAEGRMSGTVLVALPVVMFLLLMLISPTHSRVFTTTVAGYIMIGVSTLLVLIGSLWMRKLAQMKF